MALQPQKREKCEEVFKKALVEFQEDMQKPEAWSFVKDDAGFKLYKKHKSKEKGGHATAFKVRFFFTVF